MRAIGFREGPGRSATALLNLGAAGDQTDHQLLARFAARDGHAAELAFAAVVERHGPMVLRTCRSILRDGHAADDAFQATFLVLARGAAGPGPGWMGESVAAWLHQVARRTALCARGASARRRRHEHRAATLAPSASDAPAVDDLAAVLDAEIARLPATHRAAVVLCLVEGHTHEQAARHLGWPVGTVQSRLSRARTRLRDRLARRGLDPAHAAPALLPVAPTLADRTAHAAFAFAHQTLPAGLIPAMALSLASEVRTAMIVTKAKWAGAAVLALGLGAYGVALAQSRPARPALGVTHPEPIEHPDPARPARAARPAAPAAAADPFDDEAPSGPASHDAWVAREEVEITIRRYDASGRPLDQRSIRANRDGDKPVQVTIVAVDARLDSRTRKFEDEAAQFNVRLGSPDSKPTLYRIPSQAAANGPRADGHGPARAMPDPNPVPFDSPMPKPGPDPFDGPAIAPAEVTPPDITPNHPASADPIDVVARPSSEVRSSQYSKPARVQPAQAENAAIDVGPARGITGPLADLPPPDHIQPARPAEDVAIAGPRAGAPEGIIAEPGAASPLPSPVIDGPAPRPSPQPASAPEATRPPTPMPAHDSPGLPSYWPEPTAATPAPSGVPIEPPPARPDADRRLDELERKLDRILEKLGEARDSERTPS